MTKFSIDDSTDSTDDAPEEDPLEGTAFGEEPPDKVVDEPEEHWFSREATIKIDGEVCEEIEDFTGNFSIEKAEDADIPQRVYEGSMEHSFSMTFDIDIEEKFDAITDALLMAVGAKGDGSDRCLSEMDMGDILARKRRRRGEDD